MPEWKRQIYEVRMAKQKHEEELRKRREVSNAFVGITPVYTQEPQRLKEL